MANLDTRRKRASSVGIMLAFVLAPPLPDATIDQGDRQHIAVSYAGILSGGYVPPVVTAYLISQHPFQHIPGRLPGDPSQGHQPLPRISFHRRMG